MTGGRHVRAGGERSRRWPLVALGLAAAAGLVMAGGAIVVGRSAPAAAGAPAPEAVSPHPGHGSAAASPSPSASAQVVGHGEVSSADAEAATDYSRLRDRVLGVLDSRGPARALRALDRAIEQDPEVSGICHAVAHDLGHATLDFFEGDAAKALAVRNDVCGGGYTHGVVEMALGESRNIARDMLTVCAPSNDGSCFHGVGHGVMFASKYNVDRALRLCDGAPNLDLSVRCGEGVFMQLFTLDDGASHMASATFEQPTPRTARSICVAQRDPYDGSCWFYSPTVWLQMHPEDWEGVVDWCARAPAGVGRDTCARGVGSRLVKYHPDDLPFGAGVCATVAEGQVDDCLKGMGSYWSVHWKGQRAPNDICGRLDDARMESNCWNALA